jgi:hypothetical protein
VRGWLLDTNIVSELRRPKPASAVIEFVAAQPGELLFTTEVTFGKSDSESNSSKMRVAGLIFIYGSTERFGHCSPTASSQLPRT